MWDDHPILSHFSKSSNVITSAGYLYTAAVLRAADALLGLGLAAPNNATGRTTLRGAASGDGAPLGPRCVLQGGTSKKEVNAGKFLEIFLLGFYKISPKFFCISLVGGGLICLSFISFLGIESTYIRSLSNHWPKLDQKNKGWAGDPSQDAIGGPGFLAKLQPCKQ